MEKWNKLWKHTNNFIYGTFSVIANQAFTVCVDFRKLKELHFCISHKYENEDERMARLGLTVKKKMGVKTGRKQKYSFISDYHLDSIFKEK